MATIGRYIVERELGRGAMGVVYLATDPHLGRKVALKTYTLPEGVDPALAAEFHERFLREARAAASLSHPGLVTVFDAGEDAARRLPFIAMEFVDGLSLKQKLEQEGPLDPAWVLRAGAVLAEALGVAHRAGIVHRDIKPANILIRAEDGAAKIADFGVAHLKSSELTQTGTAPGSPGYMSPEQITSGDVDGRSDLFSLAVVLYEALSGKRPFKGNDLVALTYAIAHETQVPLRRQMKNCTAALDSVFDRALSKDPSKRFQDAASFRDALVEAARARPEDPSEGTIVEPGIGATTPLPGMTVPLPPGARAAAASPLAAKAASAVAAKAAPPLAAKPPVVSEVREAPRRRRLAPLAVGGVALAAAGCAVAWFTLARPDLLRAGIRPGPTVPSAAASTPAGAASTADANAPAGNGGTPLPRREDILQEVKPVEPVAAPRPEPPPVPRPVPQAPRPAPRSVDFTLPAGTGIETALQSEVASASSRLGEPVTVKVMQPVLSGNRVVIPSGSTITGRVSAVTPAHKGLANKGGSVTISFERLTTASGGSVPLAATLTREGAASTGKTAGAIGGGAAGGAILGKVFGKSSRKAAVGSVLGAAIGTGVAASTRGEDVTLAAGAPLTLHLDRSLTLALRR